MMKRYILIFLILSFIVNLMHIIIIGVFILILWSNLYYNPTLVVHIKLPRLTFASCIAMDLSSLKAPRPRGNTTQTRLIYPSFFYFSTISCAWRWSFSLVNSPIFMLYSRTWSIMPVKLLSLYTSWIFYNISIVCSKATNLIFNQSISSSLVEIISFRFSSAPLTYFCTVFFKSRSNFIWSTKSK